MAGVDASLGGVPPRVDTVFHSMVDLDEDDHEGRASTVTLSDSNAENASEESCLDSELDDVFEHLGTWGHGVSDRHLADGRPDAQVAEGLLARGIRLAKGLASATLCKRRNCPVRRGSPGFCTGTRFGAPFRPSVWSPDSAATGHESAGHGTGGQSAHGDSPRGRAGRGVRTRAERSGSGSEGEAEAARNHPRDVRGRRR